MTRLTSLTLSNVRRFGSDVNIDFSPGATVLLAPNGTGKTAVFEAIELALTGAVARLPDGLDPMIRDGAESLEIRLGLTEGGRRVVLHRQQKPELSGNLKPLLGDAEASDLPYLLRLTHLLDQRERDWFVHADAKEAGLQLGKLPVGRDGAQASAVLVAARRHMTEQLNQAVLDLQSARIARDEWTGLLQERDRSLEQLHGSLKSSAEIVELLIPVAASVDDRTLPTTASISELAHMQEALERKLSERLAGIDQRLMGLSSVTGEWDAFGAERDRVSRLQSDQQASTEAVRIHHQHIAQRMLVLSQRAEEIAQSERRRSDIAQRLARLGEEAKAKNELELCTRAVLQAGADLTVAEVELASARDRHQAMAQINLVRDGFRTRQLSLQQTHQRLQEAKQLVQRWEELDHESRATLQALEQSTEHLQASTAAYQAAVIEHATREREETDARHALQIVAAVADSMRQAVSMVAEHLPAHREDCPVCGVVHGAQELRRRVQTSLSAIDPLLGTSEQQLHDATQAQREALGRLSAVKETLQAARTAVADIEIRRTALTTEDAAIRAHPLIAADSSDHARDVLDRQARELEGAQNTLAAELSSAPDPVSIDEFTQATATLDLATQRWQNARNSDAQSRVQLEHATRVYASISDTSDAATTTQDLSIAESEVNRELAASQAAYQAESEALARHQAQLNSQEAAARDVESQLQLALSRLAVMQSTWQQRGLPGEPSPDIAAAITLQLSSERSVLERHRAQLNAAEIEISLWQRTDEHRFAQSVIDRRRGSLPEATITAQLDTRLEQTDASIKDLSRLSQAFETLATLLSSEIGNIHEHVIAVVPRWRTLLKRIVRDQRFAQTSLEFYSHYKKGHATVQVPLHGASVPVPSVASEAQMTDLQLTFLLSMSVRHRWSPWRGLLLDDPTQHHDLIQAASVFDVLRDYIAEHGFQVVLATHDALQARFFLRKLQNDGIQSRLWTLTPSTNGGVAARET